MSVCSWHVGYLQMAVDDVAVGELASGWWHRPANVVEAIGAARPVGTEYIPGVTEERALQRIERLLERHLANPID